MTSLLRMSLSGAVIILAVVVVRAIAMHRLPKKALPVFWAIAVARLLLPISFPPPFLRPANRRIPASAENYLSLLEKETARVLRADQAAISVLRLIWIAGAALCFGWFVLRYLRCRREFKTSLPVQNDFVEQWLSEHRLRRRIDVRSLTGISTPLTYGLFHPVILMPKNTDWGEERSLRYVLFHEYVHICRFDALWKWIVAVTACVHWFNPMVWVLYILFHRDVELACDERVLQRFGESDRALYARSLIRMEEARHNFAPFCNHFAKNAIEERIEAIMKFSKKSICALVLALVLIVTVTGVVFATDPAPDNTGNSTSPSDSSEPSGAEVQEETPKVGLVKCGYEDENGQIIYLYD